MSHPSMDIETRVAISLAIGRYLRAMAKFETATMEFNQACSMLRNHLSEPSRFIARVDSRHYLVTSDRDRDFEVEELELI